MDYSEVKPWKGTQKAMRGDAYESFKEERMQKVLKLLEDKFPGIRSCMQSCYSATPLTYEHYVGSPNGTAYGIEKDFNNPYKTIVLPKTKVPNLYFTGQNLNMHGALGVTIGAVLTSSEILGLDYLINKIKKEIR
jgi:all-trans-retinol 13,14-reductase